MITDDKHNYFGSWLPLLSSFCCCCIKLSQCYQLHGQKHCEDTGFLLRKGQTFRETKHLRHTAAAVTDSCLLKHEVFKMHLSTLQNEGQRATGSRFHYPAVKPTDRKALVTNQFDW